MGFCSYCGAPLPEGNSRFCPSCGAAQPVGPVNAADSRRAARNMRMVRRSRMPLFVNAPPGLTKREFIRSYSNGAKQCVSAAILGYVCAGITAFFIMTGWFGFVDQSAFLDVAILVVLSVLIHTLKSRIASIILFIYALYSIVIMLIASGMFSGWLVAIAGMMALSGSFTAVKEWKMYLVRSYNISQMSQQ